MSFSFRRLRKAHLIAVGVIALAGITTLAVTRFGWFKTSSVANPAAGAPAQTRVKASPLGKGYLQRKGIWPQLRSALDAYGDRLEKPGKERLIAVGTISNTNHSINDKIPVRLISEFPDKLRLEKQNNGKIETTIFDGKTKFKLGGAIKKEEEDELDSLVFDSLEHFLAGQLQGYAIRFLGDRFRLDDGKSPNYTGPFYDIYQMMEPLSDIRNEKKHVILQKHYYLNSDTHRLERVTYELTGRDGVVNVVIQIAGWQKVNGQNLPTSITRYENGKPTLTLTINTITLSPRAEDGIFTNPQK